MTEERKQRSHQFADQIRQLELEGSRLMNATSNLGESLGLSTSSARPQNGSQDVASTSGLGTSLRALADITAEQRTIDEMRHQLDAQSKETERLTKDLLSDANGFRYTSSGSLLDKLDIPTGGRGTAGSRNNTIRPSSSSVAGINGIGAVGSTTHNSSTAGLGTNVGGHGVVTTSSEDLQYMTRLQLERSLRDCRQDVTSIRGQMADTIAISEKQKEHFRSTIEDLRSKLQEALVEKDMTVTNKNRESATQEAKLYKFQQQSEHLEEVNKRQEEMLAEQKKKIDTLQREQYNSDMAISQVRSLVLEQERNHGRSFYDGQNLTSQDAVQVVNALEKCVRVLETEVQNKNRHNRQLSTELEEIKVLAEEKCRLMVQEHHERMSQMQSEHDKQIDVASERSLNAKQQVGVLQDQLQTIQRQMEQQLRLKEEYISELESRLRGAKDEGEEERRSWRERKDALELACDTAQRELSLLKQEREEAIRQAAVMDSRYTDMQRTIQKLESEADSVAIEKRRLTEKEKDLTRREDQVKGQLQEKDREIESMRKALDTVREECSSQLQQTVMSLEKEGKLMVAEENKLLTTQLTSVTEKCHRLTVENELSKSQQENLREKYNDLKTEYNSLKDQLQIAVTSKAHMSELVQSRATDIERCAAERDRYLKQLEERASEMSELKATREKLRIQLEEREKNCVALQQERDKMSDNADSSSRSRQELKDERDDLLRRMNEKIIETEELRHGRDALSKKLRLRESHLQELQGDNVKLAQELHNIRGESEELSKEKNSLLEELKESRYDVSNLKDEVTTLQRRLEAKQGDMGKEINKLTQKLKNAEHDLKLARKALKTREQVDGTAVKVAGKMQKAVTEKRGQIDSLQSRVRWLEDCLDTITKEKKMLKEESARMVQTIKRSVEQNERLRAEVQEYIRRNGDLRDTVNKMEAALEKAAVKHAASQAKVEQYEQDLARLKLRHQLEIKEMERSGRQKPTLKASQRDNILDEELTTQSATDLAVNDDLRALVSEMRSVLNSHTARVSIAKAPSQDGDGFYLSGTKEAHPHFTKSDQEVLKDVLSRYQNPQPTSDLDLYMSGNMKPTKLTSSSKMTSGKSGHHYRSSKNGKQGSSQKPVNGDLETVSDLLTYHDHGHESDLSEVSVEQSDVQKQPKQTASIITDVKTQELCKRLEKKIENLTKVGGELSLENQDTSSMMKNQDRKAKKSKSQLVK